MNIQCPLCSQRATLIEKTICNEFIECPGCGFFEISEDIKTKISDLFSNNDRIKLSRHIRRNSSITHRFYLLNPKIIHVMPFLK